MNKDLTERRVWLYARSSAKQLDVLQMQMKKLLTEAENRGYTVVGTAQDRCRSTGAIREGLQETMRAVRKGFAQAVFVRDLSRLSRNTAVIKQILEYLQNHDAVLITADSDLRYELHTRGLEEGLLRRAARKHCNVPW